MICPRSQEKSVPGRGNGKYKGPGAGCASLLEGWKEPSVIELGELGDEI